MSSSNNNWESVAAAAHCRSRSIPISGISRSRSQSELEDLARAELLADYRDGQMYERIMSGILRRSDRKGTYHPKTLTSLKNIIHTKMLDYCISEERRSDHVDEDWFVGDKCDCEPVHSHPVRDLIRHKEGSKPTPFCSSSAHERQSLEGSETSLSCFSIKTISGDSELEAEESEIFEFEF